MLSPAPRDNDRAILAKVPVPPNSNKVTEPTRRSPDQCVRMVESLDELAKALNDIDQGLF